MSLSGTTTFRLRVGDLMRLALGLLGVIEEGQPISNEQADDARNLLAVLLHSYQAKGLRLWKAGQSSVNVVSGTGSYSLGRVVQDILADEVILRDTTSGTNIDTRLAQLTREQYMGLPNKSTTGKPTCFYAERNTVNTSSGVDHPGGVKLYLWPVPDSSAYDLLLTAHERVNDVSLDSYDIDAPTRWYEAILYGWAYVMSFQHRVPVDRRRALERERDKSLDFARKDDSERGGVRVAPRMRG